jgi:hypothetical protein
MFASDDLLRFLPIGYLVTVFIETLVLLVLMSRRHSIGRRVFLGFWLTACTYPIVILVLPSIPVFANNRLWYVIVAETFAPVVECLVFWLAYRDLQPKNSVAFRRDFLAIVVANLASFGIGEWLSAIGFWDWFF